MTIKSDKQTGEVRATFASWLGEHRHGVADLDLTEALRGLVEQVASTRKNGSMSLTIKVSAEGDMLVISDSLSVKLPTLAESSMYWVNQDGDLTRNNPMQPQLPLNGETE